MNPGTRHLVLAGAGHAHVEVLRRWAAYPVAGVRLTVVTNAERAIYSGMVPGFAAGQYDAPQLEIDIPSLAERAGADFVLAEISGIDADEQRIHTKGGPSVEYDIASLDLGSTVAGADVPGVREHALSTRPIGDLIDRIAHDLARLRTLSKPLRLVVVGGGAGGIELAFCLEARLREEGSAGARISVVESAPRVLSRASTAIIERVQRAAARRRIELRCEERVARVLERSLVLESGESLEADLTIWAAGAAAHSFLRESGLPIDGRGFVRVSRTLQVEGRDDLFAVGDCASLPGVPKAGVYAVRAGPVLSKNLRARLAGRALVAYRPQKDFLSLLNLGDGTAIGGKWGLAVEGTGVMRVKDWIDRRFMARYR